MDVPKDFDSKISSENKTNINIIYDEDSNKSNMAYSMLKETFDKYSNNIVNNRLKSKGISESVLTPFDIKQSTLSKQSGDSMAQGILNVLPTIIIIFMISPTIGIAADLIAGEKREGDF